MYSLQELMNSSGNSLYHFAKTMIPGGTQLLSKRPEMFAPDVWPPYYSKAKGVEVWDLDGRCFIDMSIMSVGAAILGYADNDVDKEVISTIKNGVCSSLNSSLEVELTKQLLELHPWFDCARFARSGGEALSIAVRIARAHTKKTKVLFSGYHGWSDWYLAANLSGDELNGQLMPGLSPVGVPNGLAGTAKPFFANSLESLQSALHNAEKDVAAIVIEPARGEDAPEGFLEYLRELSTEINAVLIFDEITSGFRMCAGGIHRNYKIQPDLAVFAKSMANGYAMSAILGTKDVLSSAQDTFISSTNWTEAVGPAAAVATIQKYIDVEAEKTLIDTGNKVKKIWEKCAAKHNISISVSGLPSLSSFTFNEKSATVLETIFTIELLKMGFLGFRQFKSSFSHSDDHLAKYEIACEKAFGHLSANLSGNSLSTEPHHTGFFRLTAE